MAKLIKANGQVSDVSPAKGKKFTLVELQKLVGGYIEIQRTQHKKKICTMVMDEEGKLKANAQVNHTATQLLFKEYAYINGHVVGDVLVCGKGEF